MHSITFPITNSPNQDMFRVLSRHEAESIDSIPPQPTHKIVKVGKHGFHVEFKYPDGEVKMFDGKHWN